MRICYLTEADLSIDNGRGINEREFVDAAIDDPAAEIVCVAPRPADPGNHFREEIEYVRHHGHGASGYALYLLQAYRRIAALHDRSPFDGLAARLDVSPLVPYAAHRRLGLPLALKTLVGRQVFSGEKSAPTRPHQVAKRVLRGLFRRTIEGARCADTVSTVLAEGLRRVFGFSPEELIVIRNGANLERFSPAGDRAERAGPAGPFDTVVGYVGGLAPDRHLPDAVRAFARAAERDAGLALVLVGDGPERDALEAIAADEDVRDRVFFTGHVPYERVPAHMRSFDVALDLSAIPVAYDGPRRLASFSQKIAQYLGCGCPVMAWRLEDTRFLDDAGVGWTVPFADPDALTSALLRAAATSADGRERLRRRARRYAERELDAGALARRRIRFWADAFGGPERRRPPATGRTREQGAGRRRAGA